MDLFSIAKAVASGVVSIPVDLFYGARRTAEDVGLMGSQVRLENAAERERLFNLLNDAFKNRSILTRLVEILLNNFFDKIPESALNTMAAKAGYGAVRYGARYATQTFLVNLISKKVVEAAITKAVAQRIAKFGVGLAVSAVLFQGLLERASNSSQKLRTEHPAIYQQLRRENLDMLYFIVEDFMEPYMQAIKLATTNAAEFQRLLDQILKEINR